MRNLTIVFLLVTVTGSLILSKSAQQLVSDVALARIGSFDVWARTGPLNSATGTYSYINDRSILAYGNDVWAGGNGDGMYMSRDGGRTWNNRSAGLPRDAHGNVSVYAKHLAGSFNPARPTRLYIGTPDVNHLYRSDDGGFNWNMVYKSGVPYVDSTTTSLFVANVPLAGPAEFPDQLWVSVYGYSSGVYFSLDSGITWAPFDPSGLPATECQVVSGKEGDLTHDQDLVFAACLSSRAGIGSIYRSLAHNANWTSANVGLPANIFVNVISPSNKDGKRRLYLGLSSYFSNGPAHVYRTDDNGDSWQSASNGLPTDADVMDIVVDVRNSDVAYAALLGRTGGVYKTIDAGRNWFLFSNGLTTSTGAGLALGVAAPSMSDPALVHLGTHNGVWSITDTNAGTCNVSLSEPVRSVPSWQDTYRVNVTANAGCRWSAIASDPSWLKLGTPSSGIGSGTITFEILQNTQLAARSGTISIGGSLLSITQSGSSACEYYLPFASQNIGPGAGTGLSFILKTTSQNCPWNAFSTVPQWLTVTPPAAGSGTSSIRYSVTASTDPQSRTGSITVAGRSFTVNQFSSSADPCRNRTAIVVGQIANGSLSDSDCQAAGGSRDFYLFKGRVGQRIAIEMNAQAFTPYLYFVPDGESESPGFPNPGQHFFRYPGASATTFETLPQSGDYIIKAFSQDGGIGDYSIKVLDADGVCPPMPIVAGTYLGSLSSSDCGNQFLGYSDLFTFFGTQGQKVTISASSAKADIWLILYNDDTSLQSDHEVLGGAGARIPHNSGEFTLPTTGIYRIEIATHNTSTMTGDYTFTLTLH